MGNATMTMGKMLSNILHETIKDSNTTMYYHYLLDMRMEGRMLEPTCIQIGNPVDYLTPVHKVLCSRTSRAV